MPKRIVLFALFAAVPAGWFMLEGAWLAVRFGGILSRYGAEGLTGAISSIALTRDIAARHAAWAVCIALALWRSLPGDPLDEGDEVRPWVQWVATWFWVLVLACAGALVGSASALGVSWLLGHAALGGLARRVAEMARPQDLAVLVLRASVFATVVTLGAHAWRTRLGPKRGARNWQATLWRAGATCALLTLLDLVPWWRVADGEPPGGGFPIDYTTFS